MIETSIGVANKYIIVMCDNVGDIHPDHKTQIYKILSDAFHRSIDGSYLAAMAHTIAFQTGVYYLYMMDGDEVVGYCNVAIGQSTTDTSSDEVVFVSNVATSIHHRKKGIATMLVQRVIDRFNQDNLKLEIDNNDDVTWKHKFYQKLGFEKIKFNKMANRFCMQYKK